MRNDGVEIWKCIIVLPVHSASVSVIASKMSTDGFNRPSWIILVLSSWELLHWGYTKIIIFFKKKKRSRKLKSTLRNFLCQIKVLHQTVNLCFKSDTTWASNKMGKKILRRELMIWSGNVAGEHGMIIKYYF